MAKNSPNLLATFLEIVPFFQDKSLGGKSSCCHLACLDKNFIFERKGNAILILQMALPLELKVSKTLLKGALWPRQGATKASVAFV